MAKKKIKSPAKKNVKSGVKAKSKAPAKTKSKATKAKAPVKKTTKKAPVKAKPKAPAAKAKNAKSAAPVKTKPVAKAKKVTKPVVPTILPHGQDHHFIPVHDKNAPVIHPDGHLAENQFHHNEEVALHQENQRVKANLATRMGRKPIFRNARRG